MRRALAYLLDNEGNSSDGTAATVRRIVDGKLVETIKLDSREWRTAVHRQGRGVFDGTWMIWNRSKNLGTIAGYGAMRANR